MVDKQFFHSNRFKPQEIYKKQIKTIEIIEIIDVHQPSTFSRNRTAAILILGSREKQPDTGHVALARCWPLLDDDRSREQLSHPRHLQSPGGVRLEGFSNKR